MPEIGLADPDLVRVQRDPRGGWASAGDGGVAVVLERRGAACRVSVAAPHGVSRVHLRWRRTVDARSLVLGDAWERGYGDLQWRAVRSETPLPWTALVHDPVQGTTEGFGVEVRGGAFAFWTVDRAGLGLWLDLRSGGAPVLPGERVVHAATVRAVAGEPTPFATQRSLAALQCADPLPTGPVVGANNWYYAYGRGFGRDAVLRDARTVVALADGHPIAPFAVVDDGWTPGGVADGRTASGGPWDVGRGRDFGRMADVAAAVRAEGARPGVWFRPLLRRDAWGPGAIGARDGGVALDPSHPAVLDLVGDDVRRLVAQGFDLLKHDFSTYDLLGRWGWGMGASPAEDGPALADPSVTTAEALVELYRRIRAAAGRALVLGCDTVGHLAAGLVDVQRVGDDTSGVEWDRTRRVGVNSLAFRLGQHGRFFAIDADCVPCTPVTDWDRNREFLDLVARSGTALFVSVDPASRSARVDADLSRAVRLALDGGDPGGVEPLDWLTDPTPALWRSGAGEVRYRWLADEGADPFESAFESATR